MSVGSETRFCNAHNLPILAQNGGSGWAQTFDLGKKGVIINLASLNQTSVSPDKKAMTIGGGATVQTTIEAAAKAGVLVQTGNCNCVGVMGAYLGGGYGNLMGLHGLRVDNVVSMRVDYFWALRGAGPNFGIVTSAVVKACPVKPEDALAWTGGLIFNPDKLEQLVQAIEELVLKPEMNIFLYFLWSGPPTNAPVIIINVFLYKGTPEAGREAFASIYDIGPMMDLTQVVTYPQWNTGGDAFCVKGGRKPAFGAGLQKMIPQDWREVWNQYVEFQKLPGAQNSGVLVEAYPLEKAQSIPACWSAFPHRNVEYQAIVIPWYDDPVLDDTALAFGKSVRDVWRNNNRVGNNATYINFAHGDDELEAVYGSSLPRLRELKRRLDPKNRFDQWFNIQ
ncbi:FAD-binding domain-containing protein [Sporormia fimetaria CBS 119925]|uniref:FAD-binding domain-containing protein n=1 Tax=Sporormia fimetaria CBS 119925 TaxID=1340428 RepID=A0A6A6V439_9PLEO|nr:FAD-binding domain-containing protein [Sporormia fimetaria CBS 119925]